MLLESPVPMLVGIYEIPDNIDCIEVKKETKKKAKILHFYGFRYKRSILWFNLDKNTR